MIPLFKKFWNALLNDEMAVKRWLRAGLMAVAGSGMMWADQLAEIIGAPVKGLKVVAVICGALSVAINLGDKNKPEGESNAKPADPGV